MLNIGLVIGTRPEAIKLIPVYLELKNRAEFNPIIISTGQHKEMLKQVFDLFNVTPDVDLGVMSSNQTLNKLSKTLIEALDPVYGQFEIQAIIVQGDTTTAAMGALTAFHRNIKVFHVEAGLRSFNKRNPFPEEANRKLISVYSDFNFTPTDEATNNLIKEGIDNSIILNVGNTVIDSVLLLKDKVKEDQDKYFELFNSFIKEDDRYVLITAHRRESFDGGLENAFEGIKRLARANRDVKFIYPVHLNPNVQNTVNRLLKGEENIKLIEPVAYDEMIFLMSHCSFIITDSGGIQEEAPSLNKPVLVIRENTERMEGVDAGCSILVGTTSESIYTHGKKLLEDETTYNKMKNALNPFGDGKSAQYIADKLLELF